MRTNLAKWRARRLAKSSYSGEGAKVVWSGMGANSRDHTVKRSRELRQELEVGLTGCLHDGRTNSTSASQWGWSGRREQN